MIRFENVEIRYGDFVAIKNISFEINEGEFFTLLGPSGCGKTTTLRALAGFTNPSSGKIFVKDQEINNVPIEERNIGMVFQSYALFPTMTVYENIAFGLNVAKVDKATIDKRVREIAKLVELNDEQLLRNVSELSGGQQQRVAIARALAKHPEIVVFDEPLSNLDAKLRKQLRLELKKIQDQTKMTAMYVTHDQEEALTLSDRIAVFNNGYIEQIGTPEEIYNQSATEFVCNFIGDANKLTPEFIKMVNEGAGEKKLDENKTSYIRTEKIKTWRHEDDNVSVPLKAKVLDKEFYGTNAMYTYQVGDCKIRNLEKEDGNLVQEIGEEIEIYIDPSNVLQYEVK